MMISVTSGPAQEPITLARAKAQLRLDIEDDDDLIMGVYVPAARDYIERHTGRKLATQTLTVKMAAFPSVIDLPVLPVSSVSSVKYYDGTNTLQTLTPSAWTLAADEWSAKVHLVSGYSWPSIYDRPDAVQIEFVCGYSAVPPALMHAMLLLLGSAYENREAVATGVSLAEVPFAVQAAIATYAVRWAV